MTTPYLLGHLQNTACSVMRTQLLLFVLSDGNTTKNSMNAFEHTRRKPHHELKRGAIDETYECFYDYWHLHSYSEDLYKL
jgi:hypothetical protein